MEKDKFEKNIITCGLKKWEVLGDIKHEAKAIYCSSLPQVGVMKRGWKKKKTESWTTRSLLGEESEDIEKRITCS